MTTMKCFISEQVSMKLPNMMRRSLTFRLSAMMLTRTENRVTAREILKLSLQREKSRKCCITA